MEDSWSENVCDAFHKFLKHVKTVGRKAKKAMKANVIDMWITWVSNYGYKKLDTCNGHQRDRAPRTNDGVEFCDRYDYYYYYYYC